MKHKYSDAYLQSPTCRYFTGYKPCPGPKCDPIGERLLVIEMGGHGSVLRTTTVTEEFKKKHKHAHITFLTHQEGVATLKLAPSVDRALELNNESSMILLSEEFDYIYNYEVNPIARSLTTLIHSKEKYGFGMNKNGLPRIEDPISADLFRFQIDNNFREQCTKSVQQMLLEAVGRKWKEQKYEVYLTNKEKEFANLYMEKLDLTNSQLVGLNIGSKRKHALKRWPVDKFIELAIRLKTQMNLTPFILAGPDEAIIYQYALNKLKKYGIYGSGCSNTIGEYCALMNKCEAIVSATTFGLIGAIGLGLKTVSIHSPKPIYEVHNYGKGIKIAYSRKYDPLYSTKINEMTPEEEVNIGLDNIPVETVCSAVLKLLINDFSQREIFISKV